MSLDQRMAAAAEQPAELKETRDALAEMSPEALVDARDKLVQSRKHEREAAAASEDWKEKMKVVRFSMGAGYKGGLYIADVANNPERWPETWGDSASEDWGDIGELRQEATDLQTERRRLIEEILELTNGKEVDWGSGEENESENERDMAPELREKREELRAHQERTTALRRRVEGKIEGETRKREDAVVEAQRAIKLAERRILHGDEGTPENTLEQK